MVMIVRSVHAALQHARGVIRHAVGGGVEQDVDVKVVGRVHFASFAVEERRQTLSRDAEQL